MVAQVLVVDDELLIRQSLATALRREGYAADAAASAAEATALFASERHDVVIVDLVLGDGDGLRLLARLRAEAPDTKFLVITAQGSVEQAVAAMKLGAYDFVRKPFDLTEVLAGIRNALQMAALEQRVEYFDNRERARGLAQALVCQSPAMQRLLAEAELIARNNVPVTLIVGESGAGKQLLARTLHERSSGRGKPFVEPNCSVIPESLVESEMFGHERGAFSDARTRKLGLVEIADGGTLFLDEIGDLNAAAQAKLLTFLEDRSFRRLGGTTRRTVNARVIAATNRDLPALVGARSFREDLWFRLNGMTLRIPALRERPEDIPELAQQFISEANRTYHRSWRGLDDQALAVMQRYRWPGNARELKAVIHRSTLLNDAQLLQLAHLPAELIGAALAEPEPSSEHALARTGPLGAIPTLAEVEVMHIRRVLALCRGNKSAAAQTLGITRQTLAKKLGDDHRC